VSELEVGERPPSTLTNVEATTEVEDVDGEPPGGVLAAGLTTATTKVEDVDGGPLGVLAAGLTATTTEVEDVDGGDPGGAGGMFGSGHH
jgi:hypothetical protein